VDGTAGTPALNDLSFTNTGASASSGVVTSIVDESYAINSLNFSNSQYQLLHFQSGT
jgi:hypothetical protein